MSAPLASQEREQYTAIIDAILATADLETITRKKIRQGLERSLGGKDLSEQKDAIKKLIESRFDSISGVDTQTPAPSAHQSSNKRSATNGTAGHHDSDPSASPEPVKKKVKRSPSTEDADARLAAQLQAQEDRFARGRTTRGADKPRSTKKKAPRKKSAKKVAASDDSDLDASGDGAPPKRKAGGGFQKPFNLSEPLAELCGESQLPRPQVVKRLWQHIKGNNLQDPENKRQILCDEKMMAVFRQPKVDMFKMNKDIGQHLYPVTEE
ncbi:SWIB/MDM2 domain-containing protein [Sarocladium implicatum]|nr:SWIB/MDM2 domain-containing protein [Sarocladium implicatum]